eukprot:m.571351 g.571351  ORF g.571351 m.571351 type:complete len:128 (+) comp22266_c0_seq14:586-969(+)
MAFLQSVTEAPESAMFKLTIDYDKDSFENKLDLGIGAYRDNDGNPYVLDVVKQASAMIQQKMESGDMNHEYLPIGGLPQFCKITAEFALGEDSPAVLENRAGRYAIEFVLESAYCVAIMVHPLNNRN